MRAHWSDTTLNEICLLHQEVVRRAVLIHELTSHILWLLRLNGDPEARYTGHHRSNYSPRNGNLLPAPQPLLLACANAGGSRGAGPK